MDKALYIGCVCKRTLTSSTPIWRKDAYVNNEAVVGRVCWACYSVLHCVVMCMRVLQRAAVPRFDLGRVGSFWTCFVRPRNRIFRSEFWFVSGGFGFQRKLAYSRAKQQLGQSDQRMYQCEQWGCSGRTRVLLSCRDSSNQWFYLCVFFGSRSAQWWGMPEQHTMNMAVISNFF